ncbi:hypothetical protein HPB52_006149 [Rhipicephalus sanguineus]|uniref:Uncharacterized protein n=1 Tax=Rhipicephalus sanguineus TaxID=34632 RepID=A0A9D4SQ21_RHISA|nr:hypothetical protein HPB52_006149 [Rhipicephalus sanguineus]
MATEEPTSPPHLLPVNKGHIAIASPIIKFMMEMVEILVGMMDNVVYMVGVMVDIVGPLVGVLGKLVVWWTLGGHNGWVVETQSWWVVEQLVGVLGGCRDASCLVGDPVGKVGSLVPLSGTMVNLYHNINFFSAEIGSRMEIPC